MKKKTKLLPQLIFFNKIWLIMRLSVLINLVAVLQVSAITEAQTARISMQVSNMDIREAFREIERNSGFSFLYYDDAVGLKKNITISAIDRPVGELLDEILKDTQLSYKIYDNKFIVVSNIDAIQKQNVTGIVTDASSNEALPGVNVIVEGTTIGVITDADGKYTIEVPSPSAVLVFSYVGYNSERMEIAGKNSINISMVPDIKSLDEVVVVGYGTQKKVNMTGAVSAVKIDEKISSRSVTNVSSGLSGLVPGLLVQQSSGFAGFDGATLQIRGLGSVNNSAPLIVVDGMPDVDINRINMNDIESISVLKDAASSAVYGSRAANGVILITTKTGKSDTKAKINYTGSYAVSDISNFYSYLDDYSRAMTMQMRASATGNNSSSFKDGSIEQWLSRSMVDPILFPNTNQYKEVFRQGNVQTHNISASGGGDKFNFYISSGVMKQKGLQINNDYDRYNFRANLDYKIRKNITVGSRMDGQWSNSSYPRSAGLESGGLRYAVSGILDVNPETGQYGGGTAYGENAAAGNMIAEYTVYHNKRNQQQYNGSFYGIWEIVDGLKVRADYSLRYYNQFTNSFNDPTIQWNFQTGIPSRTMIADNAGDYQEFLQGYKTLLQGQITYDKEIFTGHHLTLLGATTEEYWFDRNLNASRNDRLHPSLSELDASLQTTQTSGGNSSSEGLRSYIGRLNYTMLDRYLLEANFRYDGSSKFAKGHQYGFFPSVALGWRISEEDFFGSLKSTVNNLKIRASIGSLGNNAGVGRTEQQQVLALTNYIYNANLYKGFSATKMVNPDLTWESTKVVNIGMDLGLFNNKLTAELDWYDRLTTDMIRPSDFSTLLSGYTAPRRNIGDLRNRGFETNLNWHSSIGSVKYSINFNASFNKNYLEKWNEFLAKGWIYLDMPYHFAYGYAANDNLIQSWNEIYNAPYQASTYMAPGDVLLKDLNGDGQITGEDKQASANKYRDMASGQYGLTLTAEWKGFDLMALVQAATGRWDYWMDVYNSVNIPADRFGFEEFHWNDSWTLDNRGASLPRLVTGSGGRNGDESSFWMEDASYIRMKNLQIGYNFPKSLVERCRLSNFRIYFSAENLFTLTKWRGVDPDKYKDNDPYPMVKTFAIGANIGL